MEKKIIDKIEREFKDKFDIHSFEYPHLQQEIINFWMDKIFQLQMKK